MRLIAIAFVLAFASSAQAMSPAPLHQLEGMTTEVAYGCGAGRTRVGGVCVARTTKRQARRAVRRCTAGVTCWFGVAAGGLAHGLGASAAL